MNNLNRLLQLLLTSDFDFVLVGGFAAALYGSSMVTKDIDICMLTSKENIEKLRLVLKDYNPRHRMTPQKLSFLHYPEDISIIKNIYLETTLGVLDIISTVSGVGTFELIKEHATMISLFGKQCPILSIQDLINSKKNLARQRDFVVIKELELILQKKK